MNRPLVWACAIVTLAAVPWDSHAQNADVIARLRQAIVRVQGRSPTGGSGIVVMVSHNVVRVITALHVVEGSGPRKDARPMTGHDCLAANPEIEFQVETNVRHLATACRGSDQYDLALLDVPVPANIGTQIPPLTEPQADLQSPGHYVSFLARNNGSGGGKIVENDAKPSLPEGPRFRTVGTNAEPGFSGGAVIDQAGGLTGMLLSSGSTTTALRWQTIDNILKEWGVRPTLKASTVLSDSTFRDNSPQFGPNQGARNALREYRHVLNNKDAEALARLYRNPKVPRASIDALFGDAATIGLSLQDCDNLDQSNSISCEYRLEIVRRTGSSRVYSSGCFDARKACEPDDTRLVFIFEQQMTGTYTISNVAERRIMTSPPAPAR